MPAPPHPEFPEAGGDCHVTAGRLTVGGTFTVKIATQFHRNADRGLPAHHGLACLLDARTGRPRAILDDDGPLPPCAPPRRPPPLP
ncbi:hypothetical protein QRN89_33920 [Streptomyces chengbuensis]|uniref:hypothetical protein n=1 Tax=Streptomyces TaxID=1883 RepID=UPI0025B2C854|nr:hypothetical protein [Streptomyces sp. HUAS CB01]WJY54363.1 hypothetical protein QRN89_33920 [Streptomyces sp. HUAS CB01]